MARAHTCDDCFFRKNELCALKRASICPTFRLAAGARPEKPLQASLIERPIAAHARDLVAAV